MCELTLASRFDQLPVLADWIGQLTMALSLPRTVAYRLDLVLAEAVTNIIEHGCAEGARQEIIIRCVREGDALRVEIADDAKPYDPTRRKDPPAVDRLEDATPDGRGIRLMRRYSRDMHYRFENDRNVLTLILPLE